jgi:hypothetical protein
MAHPAYAWISDIFSCKPAPLWNDEERRVVFLWAYGASGALFSHEESQQRISAFLSAWTFGGQEACDALMASFPLDSEVCEK